MATTAAHTSTATITKNNKTRSVTIARKQLNFFYATAGSFIETSPLTEIERRKLFIINKTLLNIQPPVRLLKRKNPVPSGGARPTQPRRKTRSAPFCLPIIQFCWT
jgi:hypothetical protein